MSYLIVGAGGVLAGLMPRLGGGVSLILAFNAVGDDMDYMMSNSLLCKFIHCGSTAF